MPSPARKPARRKPAQPGRAKAKAIALAAAPPPQLISPRPERRSSLGRTLLAMALLVLAALAVVLAYVRFGHPGPRTVQVELPPPTISTVPVAQAPAPKPASQPALMPAASAKAPKPVAKAPRFPMAFSLEQSADEPAELAVFPQHGRALRVIKADSSAAGKVSLSWDGLDSQGNSLAAGSYYLRLSGAKAETVRPITLQ